MYDHYKLKTRYIQYFTKNIKNFTIYIYISIAVSSIIADLIINIQCIKNIILLGSMVAVRTCGN